MPLITEQPGWNHERIDSYREVRNLDNEGRVREALGLLFPGVNGQLLDDYAALAFYLMQPGNITRNDRIEEDAKRCQRQLKDERGRGNASISRLLRTMMSRFGFADVAGVYMVGDAGEAFGRVVRNKMLFVDGISWVHGEFTHTIQWLYLAFARESGAFATHRTIPDLYAESVNHRSPYEFWAEQGGAVVKREATLWDFCVDCFMTGHVAREPNLVQNRFSDSGRSPAWVQRQLMPGGALTTTLFGRILSARYNIRMTHGGQPMSAYFDQNPDELADFYRQRAMAKMEGKPRVFVPGTRTLVPDPIGANLNQNTGQLSGRPAILGRPTGKLFSDQELGQIQARTRAYAQHGTLTGDDVEDLWLSVKIQRNV